MKTIKLTSGKNYINYHVPVNYVEADLLSEAEKEIGEIISYERIEDVKTFYSSSNSITLKFTPIDFFEVLRFARNHLGSNCIAYTNAKNKRVYDYDLTKVDL